MSPRRRLAALLAVSAAVLLVACGLPSDGMPRDLAADDLPDALSPTPSTTTSTVADPGDGTVLRIYLVDEQGELRPVGRRTADDDISTRLEELGRVTETDTESGIVTLVPAETELSGVPRVEGTILRLPLDDEFYLLEGQNRSLAAAQIVFTMTADPDAEYDAVLFVDAAGVERVIPNSEGVIPEEARAMTRDDFTGFDPLRQPDEG